MAVTETDTSIVYTGQDAINYFVQNIAPQQDQKRSDQEGNGETEAMVSPPVTLPPISGPSSIPNLGPLGGIAFGVYVGWGLGSLVAEKFDGIVEGIAETLEGFGVPSELLRGPNIHYTPAPKSLPGFPGAIRLKPKGKRARWRAPDGGVLKWDSQHGEVEAYNKRGKHQGSADPNTGEFIKDPVPGRTIEL